MIDKGDCLLKLRGTTARDDEKVEMEVEMGARYKKEMMRAIIVSINTMC